MLTVGRCAIFILQFSEMEIIRCCAIIIWLLNLIIKTFFMGKNISPLLVLALATSFIFYSCQKSIDRPADVNEIPNAVTTSRGNGVVPYMFERINEHNFSSQGWREQQVNLVSGVTTFSDFSVRVYDANGNQILP